MHTIKCAYCGKETQAWRRDKRVCSTRCEQRLRLNKPKERHCLQCDKVFLIVHRGDNNRRYCSQACSKKAATKKTLTWHQAHPDSMDGYNKTRLIKNPGAWRDKHRAQRLEAIRILGSKCLVCEVSNPNWLHADYVPTTVGKPYRHPRHLKFIKEHASDFRLLCANHHYELTLTGRIAGTAITQAQHASKASTY